MLNWEFLLKRRAALLGIEPEALLSSLHDERPSQLQSVASGSSSQLHRGGTNSPKRRRVKQQRECRTSESEPHAAVSDSTPTMTPGEPSSPNAMDDTQEEEMTGRRPSQAPDSNSNAPRQESASERQPEGSSRTASSGLGLISEPVLVGRLATVVYQSIRQTYPGRYSLHRLSLAAYLFGSKILSLGCL